MRRRINKKWFYVSVIYSDIMCFEKSLTILNWARRAKSSLCALWSLTVFQDGQFDPGFSSRFMLHSPKWQCRVWHMIGITHVIQSEETLTPIGTDERVNASIAMTADIKMCFLLKYEHKVLCDYTTNCHLIGWWEWCQIPQAPRKNKF